MRWSEIRYVIAVEREDEVAERLAAIGFHGFVTSTRPDGGLDLVLYGESAPPAAAMAALRGLGCEPVGVQDLEEAVIYAALHPEAPVELAPGVWVSPRPEAATPENVLRLELPAGPAWGDGRHPTTRLCARMLIEQRLDGGGVLDLGCGSGLLGVLAAKRGAARVDLADLDPHSLRVAEACVAANGVTARIFQGDLLAAVPEGVIYDVIVANLWADLVLDLVADPRLETVLPSGWLLVSGVNLGRRAEVRAALTGAGFIIVGEDEEAWWACFACRRPGSDQA